MKTSQQTRPIQVLFATITVLLFAACGQMDEGGAAADGPKAKIGEKVVFDDSEWVVTSARDLGGSLNHEFLDNKTTTGKFILVEFTVKNTTNEEDSIADSPVLIDSKGRKFSFGEELVMYLHGDATTITLEALPPGLGKQFSAIYEVPADSTGLAFQARELAFSPSYKLIDLGFGEKPKNGK